MHSTLNSHFDFYGGRKTGEKPSWQGREQHIKQTQLTYGTTTFGTTAVSAFPLRQPCHTTKVNIVIRFVSFLCAKYVDYSIENMKSEKCDEKLN
jgi:hypothetical protein